MTPDHGTGMHRKKGSAAVEKEKAPGTYCQRRPAPASDLRNGWCRWWLGCRRGRCRWFLPPCLCLRLGLSLRLGFPLSLSFQCCIGGSWHRGAREQGLRRSTKKKPPDLRNDRGLSGYVCQPDWVGGRGEGGPAGLARDVGDWLRNCHGTPRRMFDWRRGRRPAMGRANLACRMKCGDGCKPRRMTHGTNWPARQTLYGDTAGGAGVAYCRTSYATATQQSARQPRTRYQARTTTGEVARGGPWS